MRIDYAFLIILGALPLVRALFMDMYGKVFQIELLDDCTIYVYDRVLPSNAPKGWCKRKKSSMSHTTYFYDDRIVVYFGFFCFYVDDNNVLQVSIMLDHGYEDHTLISQNYYEADYGTYNNANKNTDIKFDPTSAGKFFIVDYNTSYFMEIDYVSPINGDDFTRRVRYTYSINVAEVTEPDISYEGLTYQSRNTKVRIDPNNPMARICTIDGTSYTMHPIKTAIETACAKYNYVSNFSASFPQKYATEIPYDSQSFAGMIITKDGKLISTDQKSYDRPPIEKDYKEVPFFFYSTSTSSYSPLFLYYKFDGSSRDFTVRFVYNEKPYTIFKPLEYMHDCKFKDETITVAAAPKMLEHNEKIISFEVYFLLNNVNFQYCVFRVDFDFSTKNSTQQLSKTDDINAYVHVQSRSTIAVNCDFGNRTVRWLLAYTENKEAELVSLDNDVSSPIFPCPNCGSDTFMYCDVNPATANKYFSAVYLLNGKEILYVGIKSDGSIKKIEYYKTQTEETNYFVQELSFTLSLDDLYNQLQRGNLTVHGEDGNNNDPVDGNGDDGDDGDETNACAPRYPWMTSVLLLILMSRIFFK